MKTLILLLFLFTLIVNAQEQAEIPPVTNDPVLPELLQDFYQSARYYKIAHIGELQDISEVKFVKSDMAMLGEIQGNSIFLNKELKQFPAMLRIVLFRQIGKLYGLPDDLKKGHNIMGTHWVLDLQHELYAIHLATREWHDRKFFEALAKKAPIKVRL
jgi:hypothetical protein